MTEKKQRVSWDEYFMNVAQWVSVRSTCERAQIGAVIVRGNNILSTGYNGSPTGLPHCKGADCLIFKSIHPDGTVEENCMLSIHAEINAISQAAKNGTAINDASIYITASPCINCLKVLINVGIRKIYYLKPYKIQNIESLVRQSEKCAGATFPNPRVGAVIVNKGKIIGKGYHERFGSTHAEVNAIQSVKAKKLLEKSILYVSLEPCCHYGKTPPCTDIILKYKIPRVVIATKDPHSLVSEKGIRMLKKSGVEVIIGIYAKEAKKLNRAFFYYHKTGKTHVSLKIAQSFDGKIALKNGQSKWITSLESRKRVHELRASHQAVLTTAQTALVDDSEMTVRLIKGHQPMRIVLDRTLRLPLTSKIFSPISRVMVFTSENNKVHPKLNSFKTLKNVEIHFVKEEKKKLDLDDVFAKLSEKGIISVLVEAGSEFIGAMILKNLVNDWYIFFSPQFFGSDARSSAGFSGLLDLTQAFKIKKIVSVEKIGTDILAIGKT
ncbi:hypothetical protein CHS0354_023719 [Potamilus streckersoni]|uniref:dCMP deaminase n=1 Tax=Potamilus streckersoni TaxID=2493646 RepID=A0AAE0RZ07_9BIVA|nr:hypothetical protein CHS0354_023719 [Potamilus streckersoni]